MVSRGQYHAIKAALSSTEKEIINYYELEWFLRHRVPTYEDVVEYINRKYEKDGKHHRLKHSALNYYFTRKNFTKALDNRGIPWQQHTQVELTPTQVAAAVTMMNFADTRSNDEKLDQLGVTSTQYYAWLKDPTFKNAIDNLADQNLAHIRPTAIGEFTKKINQGDWNAIKYWLETTGELTSNDQPQSEQLLKMIVEIIQRHVKDPDTIVAIAQDIKLAAANRTLEVATEKPAINGSVIEHDPELEAAKKQIGFG